MIYKWYHDANDAQLPKPFRTFLEYRKKTILNLKHDLCKAHLSYLTHFNKVTSSGFKLFWRERERENISKNFQYKVRTGWSSKLFCFVPTVKRSRTQTSIWQRPFFKLTDKLNFHHLKLLLVYECQKLSAKSQSQI